MRDWPNAQAAYEKALRLIETIPDEATRTGYRARVLETAGYLHHAKAKALELAPSEAQDEYRRALGLTEDEISILSPAGPSSLLIRAHLNWGEYRLALDRTAEEPVAAHLVQACDHWRAALHMARALGLRALEKEASQFLRRHCA